MGRKSGAGRLASAVLAGVLFLSTSACGSADPKPAAAQPPASAPVPVTKPFTGLRPTSVEIPKIGAKSSLITVLPNKDGQISVPSVKNPMQAAWYRLSPVPGEVGPAIVLGHVDGNHQPGIFYRLKDVSAGDEVDVERSDGKKLKFVVDRTEQVPKDTFPTQAVFGNTDKPQLRIITCGGVFDHAEHSYKDNIVVYANLAG